MAARRLRGALQLGARQRLRAAAAPPGRHTALCGLRLARLGRPGPAAWEPRAQPSRSFLNLTNKRKEYSERRIIGWVLHAGDVRRGGQRGGLQELRAVVQEIRGGVAALGPRQGPARGGLPTRAGALHVHRHPGAATPRQGCLHRRSPLQPPGDQLALQPRHPRLPPHQHRGFLDLLRVPLPAALPAGHRVLRRGGQADGGRLRAPRGQELRARDSHPPRAHVPRGPPDVRAAGPGTPGLCRARPEPTPQNIYSSASPLPLPQRPPGLP